MSVLDRLEQRLEALVESLLSRTFKGPVHPIEIARAIGRMVDREVAGGDEGSSPPSRIEVRLHAADWEALQEIFPDLREELEGYLAERIPQGEQLPAKRTRLEIGPAATVAPGAIEVTAAEDGADTRVFHLEEPGEATTDGGGPMLEILSGSQQGARFILSSGGAVVGRSGRCAVPINDPAASREHLEISRTDDGYLLVDLQSTNGTYLNEQRVTQSVLRHGDRIRIGSTVLAFQVPGRE